jgi:hypothetical protein
MGQGGQGHRRFGGIGRFSEQIQLVESLRVSREERERIFWCNAAKLLKLEMPTVAA